MELLISAPAKVLLPSCRPSENWLDDSRQRILSLLISTSWTCNARFGFESCLSHIKSCSDNSIRSKSFDIAHRRVAKETGVFSVELADALVADLVSCARGVHPIHKHPLPCPLQPQLFLVLKRAHRGQCAELMMKC